MEFYADINALHEKIREFVQQELSSYYVKMIEGTTVTTYSKLPLTIPPAYMLSYTSLTFRVLTENATHQQTCEIRVTNEGKLRLTDKRPVTR